MKSFGTFVSAIMLAFSTCAQPDYTKYSRQLDVKPSAGVIGATEQLEDFPVLLRLSEQISGFSYSDFALPNGGDLLIVDDGGRALPHEIDTWNPDGESLVWVKVPSFDGNTVLHLLYGNAQHAASGATGVWSGYVGVWHMGEAEGIAKDATGNGLDANPDGTVAEKLSEMKAGAGVVGCGRINQLLATTAYRNRLVVADYDRFNLGGTFTISGWFNAFEINGWPRLFSRRGVNNGWEQEISNQDGRVNVFGWDSTYGSIDTDPIVGKWVYLVFAYDGARVHCYSNGRLVSSLSITEVQDNASPLAIGGNAANNEYTFPGIYDEVRLCDGTLDALRVAADYATVQNPAFMQYGSAKNRTFEKVSHSAFSHFFQIGVAKNALEDGEVFRNVPVLLRLGENISGFSYSDFKQQGGGDLVIADENDVVLPHDIDVWNPGGTSLVWVRVTKLSADSRLNVYYGNSEITVRPEADTWQDYTGVWHMNSGGTEIEADATGNALDATPSGSSPQDMVALDDGAIGSARVNQLDDSSSCRNYLSVPDYEKLGDTFTVSGWFHATTLSGWSRLMSRKNSHGDDGWEFTCWSGESALDVYGDGADDVKAPVSDLSQGWNYLALVYESNKVTVYQNGKQVVQGTITAATDNGKPLSIGNNSAGTERSFIGCYDEIRLGQGAYSASRIALDYAIALNEGFLTYGNVGKVFGELPVIEKPVVKLGGNGEKVISFSVSGRAQMLLRFKSADHNLTVNLENDVVEGERSFAVPIPAGLTKDVTYAIEAVANNGAGGEITVAAEECFYNGVLKIAKESDAFEEGVRDGAFVISRLDSNGDFWVNWSLSGTAVAGTDYVNAASGRIKMEDGEDSVRLKITPSVNSALNADTTVVLTIGDGAYFQPQSTATMTIVNLAPVDRSAFSHRMELDMALEFLGDKVLTNFPVLIKLDETHKGFSYRDFKLANGADHLFVDAGGKPLVSEIDTWDENGTSLVWVVVPELAAGTKIRFYYGNGADPAGIDRSRWPGYAGVWHMNEEAGTALDSSANGLHAIPAGNRNDLMIGVAGCVGKARLNQTSTSYYGAQTNRLEVAASPKLDLGGKFTVSGWFKPNEGYVEFAERLFSRKKSESDYNGWEVSRRTLYSSTETRGIVARGASESSVSSLNFTFAETSWQHLLFAYDEEKVTIYVNGVESATGTISASSNDNGLPFAIGGTPTGTMHSFSGCYDEIRLRQGSVNSAWAEAEYRTVNDASFIKFSAPVRMEGMILIVR